MNWTGGRLNHHKNSRNRPRLRAHRYLFNDTATEQRNQLQAADRIFSAQKIQYGIEDTSLEQKSTLLQDGLSIASSYIDSRGCRRTHDNAETNSQHPARNLPFAHSTENCTALNLSKQNLLAKPDWLNVTAARPVQLKFVSAAEMSKVGRHKRRSVVGRSPCKKVRPDYSSQFTQPVLKKRKRGTEATPTSLEEIFCDNTRLLSNPSEIFPSSPPFSVVDISKQDELSSVSTLPRLELPLHDPERDSYVLLSCPNEPSYAASSLIPLQRARDFQTFEQVQAEHRKFENNTQCFTTREPDNTNSLQYYSESEAMPATGLNNSLLPESRSMGIDLPASMSADRNYLAVSSSVCNVVRAKRPSPLCSGADGVIALHSTHPRATKRAGSTSRNSEHSKRFKLDEPSSGTILTKQGIEVRDFVRPPLVYGSLLSSSAHEKPERTLGMKDVLSNSMLCNSEKDRQILEISSKERCATPTKPRQFCLDIEFDGALPAEHSLTSTPQIDRIFSANNLNSKTTDSIYSSELFLPSNSGKDARADYSTPRSQTSGLQFVPAKRFSLASEYVSCQLKSSNPVHRDVKQFSLPEVVPDGLESLPEHYHKHPPGSVFSTP